MRRIRTKFRPGQTVWVRGTAIELLDIVDEQVDQRDEHRQVCWAGMTVTGDVVEVLEDYWVSGAFSGWLYRYTRDYVATHRAQQQVILDALDLENLVTVHLATQRAMLQEIQTLQGPPPPTHGLLQYPRKRALEAQEAVLFGELP